jgi:DNA-binding response OmpR family regulator
LAADGDETLKLLASFTPDLILLDLVMPKKDGFATLSEIKANPKWSKIPVLIASNLGQTEDINKAKSLGATDYIVKADMSLEDLIVKINHLIKK